MMAAQQQTAGWVLGDLFADLVSDAFASVAVTGMSPDSRNIQTGDLFLACQGGTCHGLDFVQEALHNGAAAVAWEPTHDRPVADFANDVPAIKVPDLGQCLGLLADRFFGEPSRALRVIGVTGTNGKTTCTWLLANALEHMGVPAGLVGTLGHGRVDSLQAGERTTPDCVGVHRCLAELRDCGAKCIAMEVSSHALDQDRIAGVRIDTSVFTNLSRDHLDYHGSESEYAAAKSRLFRIEGQSLAVLYASDAFGRELLDQVVAKQIIAVTDIDMELPSHVSVLRVRAEDTGGQGMGVRFDGDFGSGVFQTRLVGHFNVINLGLALAVLLGSGYSQTAVLPALEALTPPPGRMEMLAAANAPMVIVDYAHTPDALRQALIAMREICRGALWCVFGCGGERDSGKRPLMAAAAADYADHIVITDDNPRTEDADHIIADIVAGLPDDANYFVERDRRTAITHAIENCARGDCVLVAGKGHEDYQIIGTRRRHFSDRETVAQVLGIGLGAGL